MDQGGALDCGLRLLSTGPRVNGRMSGDESVKFARRE